jgi:hypothetical protein
MTKEFIWPRIHKYEENFERSIIDSVYGYIFQYYGIEEIEQLTKEQISQIEEFKSELNEYSVLQIGFSDLLMHCEDL